MALLANDFWSFHRYMEEKRNKEDNKEGLAGKTRTKVIADYPGPASSKPEKNAVKGDKWSSDVKGAGEAAPYKGPGVDPGQRTVDTKGKGKASGLVYDGEKDLIYEPKTSVTGDDKSPVGNALDKAGEGGGGPVPTGVQKTWPNVATTSTYKYEKPKSGDPKRLMTPKSGRQPQITERFLDNTKDMPLPEFAKYVQKQLQEHCGCEKKEIPHVIAYTSGPYHPDPIQAIKYVAFLANENENLMRALLREAKRLGCVDKILGELFQIPETYSEIVAQMDGDPNIGNHIIRALENSQQTIKKKK